MQIQRNHGFWVFVGGALVYCVVAEGLHIEKAPEPHIPHVAYSSASTKDLTYLVSATTANRVLFARGDRSKIAG